MQAGRHAQEEAGAAAKAVGMVLLALLMLAAAAFVVRATARVLRRLGIEPMGALVWLGLAEWGPAATDPRPWRERFEDDLVALASGPSPGARVRAATVAASAVAVGLVEASLARRLDA